MADSGSSSRTSDATGAAGEASANATKAHADYEGAGVSIGAADEAIRRIAKLAATTATPGVIDGIGGFGASFSLDVVHMKEPVLVSSTDGVGTKLAVARATGRYDTVGIDLVAMCVDDLVCVGARPLFFLDYISTGQVLPDCIEAIVSGVAAGCRQAGCALVGGEIAEHPGEMAAGSFDIAGFSVGVVERDERLGAFRVSAGDVLIGIESPGLRSNGYSLARKVLLEGAALDLAAPAWDGADHTLADELLRPSVIYTPGVLAAIKTGFVHAAAHITGGGIPGNLIRALPEGCSAVVDSGAWTEPRIFEEIRHLGPVDDTEMSNVFNRGIGMILVIDRAGVDPVTDEVSANAPDAISSMVIGKVVEGERSVQLV